MKKISILIFLIQLYGCAFYGGGTIGTGLPLARGGASSTSYIEFTTSVYDKDYNPISNAHVFISSSKLKENAITNLNGYAELNIIADKNELIDLKVVINSKNYYASFKMNKDDIGIGSVNLILGPSNKLKIEDLELLPSFN